jgi:Antitoxin MazE-like
MRTTIADRVQKHRAKLRAAGLRPVQIWVPDTRRSGFAKECRRQSRLLHDDPHERNILAWLAKAADRQGWK